MTRDVLKQATDLAAAKIRSGVRAPIAILRAVEEVGADATIKRNRSLVAKALIKRRVARMETARERTEYLDRLAKEAAADDKPWNR